MRLSVLFKPFLLFVGEIKLMLCGENLEGHFSSHSVHPTGEQLGVLVLPLFKFHYEFEWYILLHTLFAKSEIHTLSLKRLTIHTQGERRLYSPGTKSIKKKHI